MSEPKANSDYVGLYFKESYVPNQLWLYVPHIITSQGKPSTIVEKLGMIRVKNDGRWDWFRWKQKTSWFQTYSDAITKQGVAGTRLQAMDLLLDGLPKHVDRALVGYRDKHNKPKIAQPVE